MADTPQGETVAPVAPSNDPGNTAAPIQVNSSADVDTAKREAEQARIRANQLENELAKFKQAQADAEKRQLEEKEEFKTLYEQTQSRLREIEDAQTAQERAKQLATATEAVYQDYSPTVVELAKTAGLSLTDDSEASQAALKAKLDVFQKQLGTAPATPTSNNPHTPAPASATRQELVTRNQDGVSPMALAGAKGDESAIRSYIKELPAIKRMKEIAQNGA